MKFLRESKTLQPRRLKERTSVVGAFQSFEKDVYRNVFWDPHTEQFECVRMYNYNSFVQSAVNSMVDFIIGGDIIFRSDDPDLEDLGQRYADSIHTDYWMREVVENTIKTGNGYLELDYEQGYRYPRKFYPIADSSRMFINCDQYGNPKTEKQYQMMGGDMVFVNKPNLDEYYIQRVDYNCRIEGAKWFDLTYYMGSVYKNFRIYGIPIHKDKIIHYKLNLGDIGIYGRSYLASCLDDYEALTSMERAMAIIAKYKAVPRDVLMYGDKDNPASDDEVSEVMMTLDALEMEESLIVNKPIKRETLSYAGQDIRLDYMIQHLNKKMIAGLAPDFLMGLGDQVNRATATVELLAYILSIYSKRKIFLKPLEEFIFKPWVDNNNPTDADWWLEFGELSLETKQEKTSRALQEWTSNTITLNEYREEVGRSMVEGEKGEMMFGELQNSMQPDMFGGMDLFGGGGEPESQFSDTEMEKFREMKVPADYTLLEKTYVKDPSEAPEGAKVTKGPRGGWSYEEPVGGAGKDSGGNKFSTVQQHFENKYGKKTFNKKYKPILDDIADDLSKLDIVSPEAKEKNLDHLLWKIDNQYDIFDERDRDVLKDLIWRKTKTNSGNKKDLTDFNSAFEDYEKAIGAWDKNFGNESPKTLELERQRDIAAQNFGYSSKEYDDAKQKLKDWNKSGADAYNQRIKPYIDRLLDKIPDLSSAKIDYSPRDEKYENYLQAYCGENYDVVEMSPQKFLDLSTPMSFVSPSSIKSIVEGFADGKMDLGFFEIKDGKIINHEGRHRALVAQKANIPTIKVAVPQGTDISKLKRQQ